MATNNTIKESLNDLVTKMGATPAGNTINEVIDSLTDAIDDGDALVLSGLGDVDVSSPTNGQVLKYNGTNWVNGTDTDTNTDALEDLTDVTVTEPTNHQILAYNSTSGKWENITISVVDGVLVFGE